MLILSSCDFRNDNAKRIIIDNLPKAVGDCRVLFIPNEKAIYESIVGGKYHRRLEEFGFRADNVTVFDHTCPNVSRNLDIDLIYISGGNTFLTLQKLRDTGKVTRHRLRPRYYPLCSKWCYLYRRERRCAYRIQRYSPCSGI